MTDYTIINYEKYASLLKGHPKEFHENILNAIRYKDISLLTKIDDSKYDIYVLANYYYKIYTLIKDLNILKNCGLFHDSRILEEIVSSFKEKNEDLKDEHLFYIEKIKGCSGISWYYYWYLALYYEMYEQYDLMVEALYNGVKTPWPDKYLCKLVHIKPEKYGLNEHSKELISSDFIKGQWHYYITRPY